MRKFLISAVAVSAIVASAPAAAQYRGGYEPRPGYGQGYGYGYGSGRDIAVQLRQIDNRIDIAFNRGRLSRNEARRLSNELSRIENRFRDYLRGGLNQREHQELQYRIRDLREQLREDRRDGRRYDERYDDRYERRW